MYRFLPDVGLCKFYPEGFRVFYDYKNNKYMGLMTGISGKGSRIKAKNDLMQKWCEYILKEEENYTCNTYKKIFFEAIMDDARPRIKSYMTDLYDRINVNISKKDIDMFINTTLTTLST